MSGKAGRFGLAKTSLPNKYSPICQFLGDTFKVVIDIAKKKVQTFLSSAMFREVLWTPSYINSPWWDATRGMMPRQKQDMEPEIQGVVASLLVLFICDIYVIYSSTLA